MSRVDSPLTPSGRSGVGGNSVLLNEGGSEFSRSFIQNGEGCSTPEDLDTVLLEVGVFALAPPRRADLVAQLAAEGVAAQTLRDLAEFVGVYGDDPATGRRYLAAILSCPEKRKAALAGLAAHQRARNPWRGRSDHDHGEAIRRENVARVRRFDREYEEWLAAKKAGTAPQVQLRRMPWEVGA